MLDEPVPKFLIKYFGEPDPRIRDWIFVNTPKWPLFTMGLYYLIIYVGQQFMKDRKPFNLKGILIVHNFIQILLSAYMFVEMLLCVLGLKKSWYICIPLDTSNEPEAIRMAAGVWAFYATKYYDLLDTFFLVLKKKTDQMSFLHIYHHSTMVLNWYFAFIYNPGGQGFLAVSVNSFVHIVMYSYYFLAALGPWTQKYLWWKKYITQLQMIQFVTLMSHIIYGYYNGCGPSTFLTVFSISYLLSLFFLFGHFYLKQYLKKARATRKMKNIFTLPSRPVPYNSGEIDFMSAGDKKDL